jgi:hypothetical protein
MKFQEKSALAIGLDLGGVFGVALNDLFKPLDCFTVAPCEVCQSAQPLAIVFDDSLLPIEAFAVLLNCVDERIYVLRVLASTFAHFSQVATHPSQPESSALGSSRTDQVSGSFAECHTRGAVLTNTPSLPVISPC